MPGRLPHEQATVPAAVMLKTFQCCAIPAVTLIELPAVPPVTFTVRFVDVMVSVPVPDILMIELPLVEAVPVQVSVEPTAEPSSARVPDVLTNAPVESVLP